MSVRFGRLAPFPLKPCEFVAPAAKDRFFHGFRLWPAGTINLGIATVNQPRESIALGRKISLRTQALSENAERLAGRIGGGLLFTLAAYVVASAGWGLSAHHSERFSLPGLVVTTVAIPVMRYLARRKIALADKLRSRAMRADAMESVTCGWLSLVAVVILAVEAVTHAWWVDSVESVVNRQVSGQARPRSMEKRGMRAAADPPRVSILYRIANGHSIVVKQNGLRA